MARRFSVIQGGLAQGHDAGVAQSAAAPRWRVDLRRATAVSDPEIAAWRELLARAGDRQTVYDDPDYLLTAAQHQSRGLDLVFAFAWRQGAGEPEMLRGVIGLAMPSALWTGSQTQIWRPSEAGAATPVLEAGFAEEARTAVIEHLRLSDPRATVAFPPAPLPRARVPAAEIVGVRPASSPEPEVERIADPGRIRDAVEQFLALDARASKRPIIADQAESLMVRVVARRFARRREASVELGRRDGEIVAGRLRLGSGLRSVVWREADRERSPASA